MKKFVNSNSKTYHHKAIEGFSDTNKFLNGGVSRGSNSKSYTWVADFIFKNKGNESINPNTGYISFVSDKDMMYQEFGNVKKIYDNYPFFKYLNRPILSEVSFELETDQYSKIGQKHSEFDIIKFINESDFIENPISGTIINHEYHRSPVFFSTGYKFDMAIVGFEKYLWDKNNHTKFKISKKSVRLDFIDIVLLNESNEDDYNNNTIPPNRILDYKINIDNPNFIFFLEDQREVVNYHTNKSDSYTPYIGVVGEYDSEFEGWDITQAIFSHKFFPQVITNGVYEPCKVISELTQQEAQVTPSGSLSFYNGNHLEDSKDQSRIIYSVTKGMFSSGNDDNYSLFKDVDGTRVYNGIDIDTERNRRHSAVVMTDPYFVVEPIGHGAIVEYILVDKDGNNITVDSSSERFLKVKAPLSIISEIDRELEKNDVNTDIINVMTVKGIEPSGFILSQTSGYYEKFQDSDNSSVFFERQNACLDDLVGLTDDDANQGLIGFGRHRKFYIDKNESKFGATDNNKYSGEIKVCGIGVSWESFINNGLVESRMDLKLYCTNYEAINCHAPGNSLTPIANLDVQLISSTDITNHTGSEVFKPMVKIPGMNGYVKILGRNKIHSINRSKDGSYEVIYNVEFPYCPGSYDVRNTPSSNYTRDFIYKKKSYINAGSHEVSSPSTVFDSSNDRYAPLGNDSFCKTELLLNYSTDITTNRIVNGGGISIADKKSISYPGHLVWRSPTERWSLSLVKSKYEGFRRYGTYQIRGDNPIDGALTDMKVFCLVDNRQWIFDQDKFCSYIGRENPSYVFKIDASIILDDFKKYQYLHGAIPDSKRWLYGYFSALSSVMAANLSDSSEKVSTINTMDIASDDTKSDLLVEVYDKESLLGDDYRSPNWRPIMSTSSDNNKIPGQLIFDNIFVADAAGTSSDDPVDFGDLSSIYIGRFVNTGSVDSFLFPDPDLNGSQNLILYDKIDKVSFHIAYAKAYNLVDYDGIKLYKIYIKDKHTIVTTDIASMEDFGSVRYQIRKPFKTLEKHTRFFSETLIATDGIDSGSLTNFIDIMASGSPSDFDRFVIDGKIYFRIRVKKGKKYQSSYESKDFNEIPYLGSGVESPVRPEDSNFPWHDGIGFKNGFDWAEIRIEENIKKLGLNYFKCSSK